jgi:hypothetical protein
VDVGGCAKESPQRIDMHLAGTGDPDNPTFWEEEELHQHFAVQRGRTIPLTVHVESRWMDR